MSTVRVLSTPLLEKVNEDSIKRKLNHVLTPGKLKNLDPDGHHIIVGAFMEGDGKCVRVFMLTKVRGSMDPRETVMDIEVAQYNKLPIVEF